MRYKDRVFGNIDISNPVILELLETYSLQRLKGVDNAGYFDPCYFPGTGFSRFEHSVGVFYLLKKFEALPEEQIAGLIHDLSHTVFSHCIDYALRTGSEKEQSHQDNIFKEFVLNSEIPEILKKYRIDLNYILNEKNFSLLEKSLPDLCADRIDYSLRTAIAFKESDFKRINYFLDNLNIENSSWVFNDIELAKEFASLFLKLNRKWFASVFSAVMLKSVGECLKYSLEKRYISEKDLYTTDQQVLDKIEKKTKEDPRLKLLFKRMNNETGFELDKKNYHFQVFCKSRVVDPLCRYRGEIKRISEVEENWSNIIKKELEPKEYYIRFLI